MPLARASSVLVLATRTSNTTQLLLCRNQKAINLSKRILAMSMSSQIPKLNDQSLFKENVAFVNGKWITAKSGKTFKVEDPATMKTIGTCTEMDKSDVQEAIKHAATAFEEFKHTLPRQRARMLRKWYDLMMDNQKDLATLITWENGKPMADAMGEVAYAASFFEWFAEEATRTYGDVIPASVEGNRVMTIKQPIGVCAMITPWNFPAAMITRKLGPAFAAGCTVVSKAPGETPYTSLAIAELGVRAGIPAEIGKELCENKTIKKLSFTGSTNVGKLLMSQSSSTLKKLSFELGGNAPFIVFDDADIDAAVAGAAGCKFRSSGQTCVCANRIYVQSGVYDEFAKKLAEKVKGFKVGPGFDKDTTHGPLIHSRAVAKAAEHVEDAKKNGATVLTGGQKLPDLGENFYDPTVLTGMTNKMRIASEETFGPVAGLFKFETEKEVVDLANESDVGLAGYFYSSDVKRVWRVAEALETGMVGINIPVISDAASPFGGVKESGFGREGSKYGIEEYTIIKTLTIGGITKEFERLPPLPEIYDAKLKKTVYTGAKLMPNIYK